MSGKLTPKEKHEITARWKKICFRGTPSKFYTDSGFWEFVKYVYTNDNHDIENPIKHLPYWKPYMQATFLHMLNCPRLWVPKSRQIMVSWMMAAFACWWARTGEYQLVVIQSKKKEDADEIVSKGKDNPTAGRIDFIEQHLPSWLRDPHICNGTGNKVGELIYHPLKVEKVSGLTVPWRGSRILAMPQGGAQVRSKTVSLFISDEAAFQDEFGDALEALMPSLMSPTDTTRFVAASSVCGGSVFNDMVLQSHNGVLDEFPNDGIPFLKPLYDMMENGVLPYGMASRETPAGHSVLQVHYAADEDKNPATENGRQWLAKASSAYGGVRTAGWRREYEIDFSSVGGLLRFPYLLDPDTKVYIPPPDNKWLKDRGAAIYAGYDYGSANPSAFEVWAVLADGTPIALWELYEPCRDYRKHCAKIKACPYFDRIKYIRCDPSLMAKDQQTESGLKSVIEQFASAGVVMSPGRRNADEALARLLEHWWADLQKPGAFITYRCPKLWWELQRARWQLHRTAEARANKNRPEAMMDRDNHAIDASAYVLDAHPAGGRVLRSGLGGFGMTFGQVKSEIMRREHDKEESRLYVGHC